MAFETIVEEHIGSNIPYTNKPMSYDRTVKTRLKDQVYDPLAPYQKMKAYSFSYLNVKKRFRIPINWQYDWGASPPGYVEKPANHADLISTAHTNPPAPNYEEVRSMASWNMYKKLSRQKAQAMVSFLERRKTASMILDRTKSIANLAFMLWRGDFPSVIKQLGLSTRHLKSRDAKQMRRYVHKYRRKYGIYPPDLRGLPSEPRVRQAIGNVSGFYMEIRYGFRPLVGDLDSGMKALADIVPPSYFNVTGGYELTRDESSSLPYGKETLITASSRTLTMKYSVTVKSTCEFANFVTKFGLDDVFSTGYEAIPFSWMLDWVYPVGQYLKNVNAVSGLKIKQSCLTEFTRFHSMTQFTAPSEYPYRGSTNVGTTEGIIMNRSLVNLPPQPLPTFKLEGLAKPWHIADAIGLLTSAVFGPKGSIGKLRI